MHAERSGESDDLRLTSTSANGNLLRSSDVQHPVHPRHALFGLYALAFLMPIGCPQAIVTNAPQTPADDRSFYLHQPVYHPEALSGIWQLSDDSGGAVGIQLILDTMVPGDEDSPVWTPQSWEKLTVGIFQSHGPEIELGEENYFSDSIRGGSVHLTGGRLQLHSASDRKGDLSFDLDLLHQPGGCWHGRFHRGSFDSVVTLCRPTKGSNTTQSPLVGTWSSDHAGRCIHISQTGPGTFTGWSDALQIPGRVLFGPDVRGPHQLYQTYGDLAKVDLANKTAVSLEFNAYDAGCCSHLFVGKLSASGSTLRGNFPWGATVWTKVHGESCVNPATLHRAQPLPCPPRKK